MSNGQVIESLQRAYIEAVDRKDPDALLALYAPDARVFDTWSVWSYESTSDRSGSVRGWLGTLDANERVRVTFEATRLIDLDSHACATAFATYAAVDSTGKVIRSMQNRLTWVVAMRDGKPTILHEHTSVPINDQLGGMLQRH